MNNFGITKTIPASITQEHVDKLYNGTLKEAEFHMAGTPSKLKPGHFVYTIYNHQLIGRLEITRFEGGHKNPKSGKPRTLVFVKCPGELLKNPIPKKGHQGTRYYDGGEWE